MHRDPTAITEIEWTLLCCSLCQCDQCKKMLLLEQFDHLYNLPSDWAKAAAPFVKSIGWSAPGEFELLCDECTAAGNSLTSRST